MGTKERGRHRLGGKHSDPITVPNNKRPRGAHAATKPRHAASPVLGKKAVPPKPDHAPTIHIPTTTTRRIKVAKHKNKITALTAIATGGLLIVGGSNAPASNVKPKAEKIKAASKSDIADPITVPLDVLLNQEKPKITTKAAPTMLAPPVVEEVQSPAPLPPMPVRQKVVTPVQVPPPVIAVAPTPSAKAGIIASAALAQVGRMQDCTMLVTNALAVAGINFHDWPAGYYGLGHAVSASEAIPGDLIYYSNGGAGLAHIAVYIGNGQAVHGGWNGNQTVVSSTNVGSGPAFIRVTA